MKHYLTDSPTQSSWFERFSQGCVRRMGQDIRQDWAITLPAMHALIHLLEAEWTQEHDLVGRELIASIGAHSVIAFCGSFCGAEVFLTDLHGLRKYFHDLHCVGHADHIIVPLLGKFKGEQSARYHLAPMAAKTDFGLSPKAWIERLIKVREAVGRVHGLALCDAGGSIVQSLVYEEAIISCLIMIQECSAEVISRESQCDGGVWDKVLLLKRIHHYDKSQRSG